MIKYNIAEILKEKPKGTKLWTPIFGNVSLYKAHGLHEESIIEVCTACSGIWPFTKDGKIKSRDEAQADLRRCSHDNPNTNHPSPRSVHLLCAMRRE